MPIAPGCHAISVNFFRDFLFLANNGNGPKIKLEQKSASIASELQTVAMAGYSIYFYQTKEQP